MNETKLAVVTTASGSLNMRKTASKSAEVIAKIPQGATVTVLMEADDWWRVQYKTAPAGARRSFSRSRKMRIIRRGGASKSSIAPETCLNLWVILR